jgi:hypothetical protein
MALIWYNNSQLAEKIRSRAKELLLEEAKTNLFIHEYIPKREIYVKA